jgi:hypothetical protein
MSSKVSEIVLLFYLYELKFKLKFFFKTSILKFKLTTSKIKFQAQCFNLQPHGMNTQFHLVVFKRLDSGENFNQMDIN